MTDQEKENWHVKIRNASAKWFEENPDYNPVFNYYDSGEVIIPGDDTYYRVPIAMWDEYHKELYKS